MNRVSQAVRRAAGNRGAGAARAVPAFLGLLSAVGLSAVGVQSAAAQSAGCEVNYVQAWSGGNGFGANVEITNLGPAITGWSLEFSFPDGQVVGNGWPVAFSQSGADVTISSNAAWNENLGMGSTFTVGFNGTFSGSNTDPSVFYLNGISLT